VLRLAAITGAPVQPLDAACGHEGARGVALVDEAWCIGCTLCLDACPVDAILGAHKRMHTVIAEVCNGCELCLPACPVDCISMEPVSGNATGWQAWSAPQAAESLARYRFHQQRVARAASEHEAQQAAKAAAKLADLAAHSQHTDPAVLDRKRAVIEAALARARAKAQPAQTDEPPP
jgi:Na+-translocating ferredoxin:NAD+ oxidoreductase subunit B